MESRSSWRAHLYDILEGKQQMHRGGTLQRLAHCQLQECRIYDLHAHDSNIVCVTVMRLCIEEQRTCNMHRTGMVLTSNKSMNATIRMCCRREPAGVVSRYSTLSDTSQWNTCKDARRHDLRLVALNAIVCSIAK